MLDNVSETNTGAQAAIAKALCAAQMEMGKALKQSNNPHFRSKYADLGNVMDACLPALNKNGIALLQPTGTDAHGPYVDTVLMHETGQSLSCRVHLVVNKNDMQGIGSAMTYARRYGLMAMAGIAPEDDDGNAAAKAAPRAKAEPEKPAPRDPAGIADGIIKAIAKCGTTDAIKDLFGPDTRASEAWDWLAMEAPEQSKRVNEAKAAREAELREAPF